MIRTILVPTDFSPTRKWHLTNAVGPNWMWSFRMHVSRSSQPRRLGRLGRLQQAAKPHIQR